ncbi:acyl carrier protein [Streptomyces sp. NPDC053086]|uniref:acyl carrier protein n=1 Tax=unclassified Streptomyces TaxID=2593676 RepID=UPI0037022FA1
MNTSTYDRLTEILAKSHGIPTDRLSPDATLAELDVDSLTMVEISIRIERDLGVMVHDSELRPTLTLGGTAALIDAKKTR